MEGNLEYVERGQLVMLGNELISNKLGRNDIKFHTLEESEVDYAEALLYGNAVATSEVNESSQEIRVRTVYSEEEFSVPLHEIVAPIVTEQAIRSHKGLFNGVLRHNDVVANPKYGPATVQMEGSNMRFVFTHPLCEWLNEDTDQEILIEMQDIMLVKAGSTRKEYIDRFMLRLAALTPADGVTLTTLRQTAELIDHRMLQLEKINCSSDFELMLKQMNIKKSTRRRVLMKQEKMVELLLRNEDEWLSFIRGNKDIPFFDENGEGANGTRNVSEETNTRGYAMDRQARDNRNNRNIQLNRYSVLNLDTGNISAADGQNNNISNRTTSADGQNSNISNRTTSADGQNSNINNTRVPRTTVLKTYDVSNFIKVAEEYPVGATLQQKMQVAYNNLRKIGVFNADGVGIYPREGVAVTLYERRIAYGEYTVLEIERRLALDNARAPRFQGLEILRAVDNPHKNFPILRKSGHTAVMEFCMKLNRSIDQLVLRRAPDGNFYALPDLVSLVSSSIRAELAEILTKPPSQITNVDIDAYLLQARQIDASSHSFKQEFPTIIRNFKLPRHGKTVYDLQASLYSRLHRLLDFVQITEHINQDRQLFKDTVKSILSHFPKDIENKEWEFYLGSANVRNGHMSIYKNFDNYLVILKTRLLTRYSGVDVDAPRRSNAKTSHYAGLFNLMENSSSSEDSDNSVSQQVAEARAELEQDLIVAYLKGKGRAGKAVLKTLKDQKCFLCGQKGHMMRQCTEQSKYSVEQLKSIARDNLSKLKKKANKKYQKKWGDRNAEVDKLSTKVLSVNAYALSSSDDRDSSSDEEVCSGSEDTIVHDGQSSDEDAEGHIEGEATVNNYRADRRRNTAKERKGGKVKRTQKTNQSYEALKEANPNKNQKELLRWQKHIQIKHILTKDYLIIVPRQTALTDASNKKSLRFKYLNDTGCLGINLAGINLMNHLLKFRTINEQDRVKLAEPVKVRTAFKDQEARHIRWCIRISVVLATIGGPLKVDNVYIHIVDEDTDAIFLGERFNEQLKLPSQKQLMGFKAKEQLFSEYIKENLKNFKLPKSNETAVQMVTLDGKALTTELTAMSAEVGEVEETKEEEEFQTEWTEQLERLTTSIAAIS